MTNICLTPCLGPLNVRPTDYLQQDDIFRVIRTIIADYDHTGLQFPIQKFILGERALQVFVVIFFIRHNLRPNNTNSCSLFYFLFIQF